MYFSKAIALVLPWLALTTCYPLIPCNCGLGNGRDICTDHSHDSGCTPLVVRPVEVAKPHGNPLPPIGGVCSCQKPHVIPAVVPRPPCRPCVQPAAGSTQQQQQHSSTSTTSTQTASENNWWVHQSSSHSGHHSGASPVTVIDDSNPAQIAPADAVSLHIAYKQSLEDCHHTSEDKLSFGFRTLPKEQPHVVRKAKNIPEEKLFNVNGQIVELKKVKCEQKSLDEEAAEGLLELAEEADEHETGEDVKHLSLGELGYAPAKIKSPGFVDVPVEEVVVNQPVHHPVSCHDGFKAGKVAIQTIPKHESYTQPEAYPEPCRDEREDQFSAALAHSSSAFSTSQSVQQTSSQNSNRVSNVILREFDRY